jgi:hypothetical protein
MQVWMLLSDRAVAVNPAALKEAVTHHAVAEQKKEDCQEDYKQEVSSPERGWLWLLSWRLGRIRWTGHIPNLTISSIVAPFDGASWDNIAEL